MSQLDQSKSSWYIVSHTFKSGQQQAWWEQMGKVDMDKFHQNCIQQGFYNHAFIPVGDGQTQMYCVWECQKAKTEADLQEFLDGPDGVTFGGRLNNTLNPIDHTKTQIPYTSQFAQVEDQKAPEAPKSSSSLHVVVHRFKAGKAQKWWDTMAKLDMAKMTSTSHDRGFANPFFIPIGDGSNLIYCFWEAKEGKTACHLQEFLDGPEGVSFDGCLMNIIEPVNQGLGGSFNLPCHF